MVPSKINIKPWYPNFKYSQRDTDEYEHRHSTENQWLQKCYGLSALAGSTIKTWYAYFKKGHRDTDDAEHRHRKEDNEISI